VKKNRAACIFSLAFYPRFAYKNFTEALMPGNEEITR